MQDSQSSQAWLIARDDTFFGVCQGLGEDLGFSPQWLRIAFALLLFWNPLAAVGGYAAAGLVVLLSRLIAPAPRTASVEAEAPADQDRADSEQADPLPIAA